MLLSLLFWHGSLWGDRLCAYFAHLFFAFTWYNRTFLFRKLFNTFTRCYWPPLEVDLTRFGGCLSWFGGCLPRFGVWLARLLVWLGPFGVRLGPVGAV